MSEEELCTSTNKAAKCLTDMQAKTLRHLHFQKKTSYELGESECEVNEKKSEKERKKKKKKKARKTKKNKQSRSRNP